METYEAKVQADGNLRVQCPLRGHALLNHPMYNKGTVFTDEERGALGLHGLLPPHVASLEEQSRRIYDGLMRKHDALEQYIGLRALQDRNEILFYRLVLDHLEEFAPIVYTPTVGLACQRYSHHFRSPRGIWITPGHRGRIYDVLGNAPYSDVRLIVVTDNERILGLGDQGAGGMGIPVGKLVLYTVGAGIHPTQTLPISLDVGTDNSELRADPLYLGWRHPRLRGAEYDALVDEFVLAVKRRWPEALLQWEDFKKQNAFNLLDRYRKVLPSFNDDIQGTAAVAVAGALTAARATGMPLDQHRIVILGAGAAGLGIASQLRNTLQAFGAKGDALTRAIAVLDSGGLLIQGRSFREASKQGFAWPAELAGKYGFSAQDPPRLLEIVETFKPTILIGTSGEPGAFSEQIVRAMAARCRRPAILPFSNPTSKSEAIPADLLEWTEGRALVATGSPFPSVEFGGQTRRIAQGNNVFIFPGVGLGALIARAREITDNLFVAAAAALAECLTHDDLASGALYPRLKDLRRVTTRVAEAVVRAARDDGSGRAIADEAIPAAVAAAMWSPHYPVYEPC